MSKAKKEQVKKAILERGVRRNSPHPDRLRRERLHKEYVESHKSKN